MLRRRNTPAYVSAGQRPEDWEEGRERSRKPQKRKKAIAFQKKQMKAIAFLKKQTKANESLMRMIMTMRMTMIMTMRMTMSLLRRQ